MPRQSSVVSIYPHEVREKKPGIYPGDFVVPPGKAISPSVLLVGPSLYYLLVDERPVRLEEPSYNVARSIVEDYIRATIDATDEAYPGLFWVDRAVESPLKECPKEIAKVITAQNLWFKRLVERADDDWKQFHRMRAISDIQRYAATALGLQREWITPSAEEIKFCPACKSAVDIDALICKTCRTVLDKERYNAIFEQKKEPTPIGV